MPAVPLQLELRPLASFWLPNTSVWNLFSTPPVDWIMVNLAKATAVPRLGEKPGDRVGSGEKEQSVPKAPSCTNF